MSDIFDVNSSIEFYKNPSESTNFQLGYTLFQSGSFSRSLPYIKKALQEKLNEKDYDSYLRCHNILLQILVELDETDELHQAQKDFEEICQQYSLSSNVKTLVCLAYYHLNTGVTQKVGEMHEGSRQKAFEFLQKALNLALDNHTAHCQDSLKDIQSKLDVMDCLYLFVIYHNATRDYEKSIKDLKNLNILLDYFFNLQEELQLDKSRTDDLEKQKIYHQVLSFVQENYSYVQRMKLGTRYVEAFIELDYKKDFQASEKILWECYEMANKTNNVYFVPYILGYMAYSYYKRKDIEQAEVFLSLAEKNQNPDRKSFSRFLENFKQETGLGGQGMTAHYDIIFNEEEHSIVEKQKGCVHFKNQFILLDILKLFISNQGSPYSKKNLAEQVWKQDYSPTTHDNKIYVTIKRLRELLEPDINNPQYICRNSKGYYLADKARVLVK